MQTLCAHDLWVCVLQVWSQVSSVLLPHDYMNFWLTGGKKVTEV